MTTVQYEYDGWSYDRLRQQRNRAHFLLPDPYRYVSVILSTRTTAAGKRKVDGVEEEEESKRLYCIDSACYHSAGPLAEGEIVAIEDMLCISCPWHHFLVSLDEGREIFLDVDPDGAVGGGGGGIDPPIRPTTGSDGLVGNHRGAAKKRTGGGGGGVPSLLPTYPLQGPDPNAPGVTVSRGNRVQRVHRATLDESSGVLTIEVETEAEIRKNPRRSDKPSENLEAGAMCMQIFDIKSKTI